MRAYRVGEALCLKVGKSIRLLDGGFRGQHAHTRLQEKQSNRPTAEVALLATRRALDEPRVVAALLGALLLRRDTHLLG